MPADALPQPRPGTRILPGTAPYRRAWADPLGRPLRGKVVLTGQTRIEAGVLVVLPAPVTVELVDGVLDVILPCGPYRMAADLRTVDGAPVSDDGTFTVSPEPER